MNKDSDECTFIANSDISKRREYRRIESTEVLPSVCKYCGSFLNPDYTHIPIDKKNSAKVMGVSCPRCYTFFSVSEKFVRKCLLDNANAKNIVLNGKSLWNYSVLKELKREKQRKDKMRERFLEKLKPKLEILSHIEGSILLITLTTDNNSTDYVITQARTKESTHNVKVFHYSSLTARKIITAIYKSQEYIELSGKKYSLGRPYYPSDKNGKKIGFPLELKPDELDIRRNGGGYASENSHKEEVVDVLLFSPCTKLYEIAHATYDCIDDFYYMDIRVFRHFLRTYGKPEAELFFERKQGYNKTGSSFENANAQSVLYVYGYNASRANDLTDSERQNILAEIVDLGICKIPKIVDLLNFFINTHPNDFEAIRKWEKDLEFISNYNINTKRFLVIT